ncbi:MAG: 1-deoxy-D-xylulose-5-phosphate reductoisomerase, partial [Oscillospiraceae bacterium]
MSLPIQYALTYPARTESGFPAPDFAKLKKLTFFDPELEKTPCLAMAMNCARSGGTSAALMSAANEEAVALFLNGKLSFNAIYDAVAEAVSALSKSGTPTLSELQNADEAARKFVLENYSKYK